MIDRPTASGLRVSMALYADVTYDSRVQREAETLSAAGHQVTIYCLSGTAPAGAPYQVVGQRPNQSSVLPDGSSPFLSGSSSLFSRLVSRARWAVGYARNVRAWGRWAVTAAGDADVWHAHDLTGLMAVGPFVRKPTNLVYDSHEIFIETGTAARLPSVLRRLLSAYEGRLARRAVTLITVNERYGAVLRRRLRPARVLIVRNCPPRWFPPATPSTRLRDAANVPAGAPLVLYHGAFAPHRGIEQLAEAMLQPGLESAHLAILGFGGSRQEIEDLILEPRFDGRVHLLDAVPPGALLEWVSGADVDAIPLQHSTMNHWLCTPNKLWESIACAVPVVVSDFPSMRPIVLDDPSGPLGGVCDPTDPASISAALRAIIDLPPDGRAALRARCLEAGHTRWNWERESATLVDLYASLGSGPVGLAE